MSTLWAIEVTPLSGRGTPWIEPESVARTRRDAWEKYRADTPPQWLKEIKRRQRRKLLRAVKVTIQLAKETP